MGVVFLATHSKRGNVAAVGPVTGLSYLITPHGTPVNTLDVPELLKMTGPPCCGEVLPFGGEVKIFGKTSASFDQMKTVPDKVFNAVALSKKRKKSTTLVTHVVEEPEDTVKIDDEPISVVVSETEKVKDKQED